MCRPEIGMKYFDKLKPEPGPSPALQKKVRLKTVGETPYDLWSTKYRTSQWPVRHCP